MAMVLVVGPADEPVTLEEAKLDMRVDADFTDHDAIIMGYIEAGRVHAETICRRCFVQQTWRLTVDRFPSPMAGRLTEYWLGQSWGLAGMGGVSEFPLTDKTGYGFQLPVSPLLSVDSIKYTDPSGVVQTMPPSDYKVLPDSTPARIYPAYGKVWPTTRQEPGAVSIQFKSGYGDKAAVPKGVKSAILMYAKAHYESTFDDGASNEYERRMAAVKSMLSPYRVLGFV